MPILAHPKHKNNNKLLVLKNSETKIGPRQNLLD